MAVAVAFGMTLKAWKIHKSEVFGPATSWFADDKAETSRTRLFNKLSEHALVKYGNQVDAIIKARYKVRTGGSAFASGLAVQYVSTEERLEEVERLLDRGYLSEAEYAKKRAKILDGL